MSLFYQPFLAEGITSLSEEESRHAVQVLRMKAGAVLELTDGQGRFYSAIVVDPNSKKCTFKVVERTEVAKPKFHTHLAIAPTKNIDRTEWFVEKAVELGLSQLTFIQCQRSERKVINLERINKVAVSAMKQSRQAWMPTMGGMIDFREVLNLSATEKFIAFVDDTNPLHLSHAFTKNSNYLVLIGPEGDFTQEELALATGAGFKKVSLGVNRLRTETAALAAVHIFSLQ
jgi:16S rRNA (uracil1498-N3)-methyltransferase